MLSSISQRPSTKRLPMRTTLMGPASVIATASCGSNSEAPVSSAESRMPEMLERDSSDKSSKMERPCRGSRGRKSRLQIRLMVRMVPAGITINMLKRLESDDCCARRRIVSMANSPCCDCSSNSFASAAAFSLSSMMAAMSLGFAFRPVRVAGKDKLSGVEPQRRRLVWPGTDDGIRPSASSSDCLSSMKVFFTTKVGTGFGSSSAIGHSFSLAPSCSRSVLDCGDIGVAMGDMAICGPTCHNS
mmetsp:Transcript_23261/g.65367  ORF Transcript_23261/g.65367 Transcript_23261/m.65367 type:complete len:244 (+) Transcript_23261:150-881(+)